MIGYQRRTAITADIFSIVGATGTIHRLASLHAVMISNGGLKMTKDSNLDDWIEYWKQKIAIAWRMSQQEEEEWLRLQMENSVRASEKPHIERSHLDTPNHTAEEE